VNDSPARTDPEEVAIGPPTPTARRLVEASVSENTRRAYAGALRRLDAWLDGGELHDVTLAAYLAELHDASRAAASAAVAAALDIGADARWQRRRHHHPSPIDTEKPIIRELTKPAAGPCRRSPDRTPERTRRRDDHHGDGSRPAAEPRAGARSAPQRPSPRHRSAA